MRLNEWEDDWTKISKEQRKAAMEWRNRVGKMLRESTDSFEREHPELIVEWTLRPGTFIRADHPEKWPPVAPEKEENNMAPEMSPEDIASEEENKQKKTAALKALRVSINTTLAEAREVADTLIQRGPGGRELSLCITNLQQGRQWAGEALGEIGHKLPEEYRDEARQ